MREHKGVKAWTIALVFVCSMAMVYAILGLIASSAVVPNLNNRPAHCYFLQSIVAQSLGSTDVKLSFYLKYLSRCVKFTGVNDVEIIRAEGVSMPECKDKAVANAMQKKVVIHKQTNFVPVFLTTFDLVR